MPKKKENWIDLQISKKIIRTMTFEDKKLDRSIEIPEIIIKNRQIHRDIKKSIHIENVIRKKATPSNHECNDRNSVLRQYLSIITSEQE